MADDLHPRPSAHFTPPWSTVKNIAAKDLDDTCIGQKVVWWDTVEEDNRSGILNAYQTRSTGTGVKVTELWMENGDYDVLLPDDTVSVFYNFDGETDGNPEYVRGIGVLLLWGVITGLIALAVVVTLWKWS